MAGITRRSILQAAAALGAVPAAVRAGQGRNQARGQALRFAFYSDTHVSLNRNLAECLAMTEEINALQPAFAINNGDVTDYGWRSEYREYAKLQAASRFPIHHTPGNHDVRWSPLGIPLFEELFKQSFGAFEHTGMLFVLLDSTVPLSHWGSYHRPQLAWLEDRLADWGREKPVFIATHHWVGRDDLRVDNELELYRIIEPYNVVLIMNGHGHSDLVWDWLGIPGFMNKGLYQGSWMQIVADPATGRASASRRTKESPELKEAWTGSLKPKPEKRRVWALGLREAAAGSAIAAPAGAAAAAWNKVRPAVIEGGRVSTRGLAPGAHHLYWKKASGEVEVDLVRLKDPESLLQPAWETQLSGGVISHLEIDDFALYASTLSGEVYALKPETGGVLWRRATGGYCHSSPVSSGPRLYVGSADKRLHCLDRRSGLPIWTVATEGPVYASAAIAKGVAAIASGDGRVYGLDAATGRLKWKFELPAAENAFIQSKAATDGARFYFGAWDSTLYALDAATGRLEWQMPCCGDMSFLYSPAIGSPAVGGGRVHVPANGNKLYAFDLETGREAWVYSSPGEKVGYSSPRLAGPALFIGCLGDNGQVRRIDAATGREVWMAETGSTIYDSSPALIDGWAAIVSVDGSVSRIDPATGRVAAQHRLLPGLGLSTPAARDGRLFAASNSGAVVGFALSE